MMMKKILATSLLVSSISTFAAPIKIGVLAPEGTGWAKLIKKMTTEIKDATKGEVEFKVYFNGSQGDEQDVLRKIRLGSLQGGIFTGKTLGEINGDVRAMEVPFTFNSNREKAAKTLNVLTPDFDKNFEKNKFKSLAMFEIGQIYLVSQKKVTDINGLKSLKIWSWDGDPIVSSLIESMNLTGVPLALPDVLASLSTGVVEAAYAPPLGIIALQWNTKTKFIIDFPIGYSVGAFLVSSQAWSKVNPTAQKIAADIAKKYESEINQSNIKDNEDALKAIAAQKVEFVKFKDTDIKTAQGYRQVIINKLKGKLFSDAIVAKIEAELKKK